MTPSRDAAFLNRVVNDATVFRGATLGILTDPVDMTPLLADERNLFLANEHGGFLLIDKGSGIYEIHTQFLPEGRGKSAIVAGRDAMKYMFSETPARALMTFCPLDNPQSAFLARACGMKRFKTVTELGVKGDMYTITKGDWSCLPSSR
jgi:hypothetical protein